jgi:hypothetical protein
MGPPGTAAVVLRRLLLKLIKQKMTVPALMEAG